MFHRNFTNLEPAVSYSEAQMKMNASSQKKQILLNLMRRISIVRDIAHKDSILASLFEADEPVVLSFVNAHAVNICATSTESARAFNGADVLLRDGVGLKLLFRLMGIPGGLNMNGTDLIPDILQRTKGRRVAVFGTSRERAEKAAAEVRADGVDVVSVLDGFQPDMTYVEEVVRVRPDIVVLGMGMPKQELISLRIKSELDQRCLIINGGAVLDFLSNEIIRAPETYRKFGLEWFYRLKQEPKRLGKRYLIGGPVFIARSVKLAVQQRIH
jgi:exopolysaccharide biosynthesis WecB/TagA/CpsF family protein